MSGPPVVERVYELVAAMYAAYSRGDTTATDDLLMDDVTIFDSAGGGLVVGKGELAALRARRVAASSASTSPYREGALRVDGLTARAVSGATVATWWLSVQALGDDGSVGAPELSRNTAVLVENAGRLLIAHLHEDVVQPLGG